MRYTFSALIIILLILQGPAHAGSGTVSDGVINLTVRIQDTVPEKTDHIDTIKTRLTEASAYLYRATKKQNRFGTIVIVAPSAWSTIEGAGEVGTITDNDYDLLIPNDKSAYAYVNAFGQKNGRAMTVGMKSFTKEENNTSGRTVIHEFGHYGYGLYDEYIRSIWKNGAWYKIFKDSQGNWIKCTSRVTWEVKPVEVGYKEKYGYPVPPSSPSDNSASIMWFQHGEPITDFCYKDHNKVCNSDQNGKNNFQSCWETMAANTKFGLKLPDDPDIAAITYREPVFEIRQGGRGSRAYRGYYMTGGTDLTIYTYPQPVEITATLFIDDTPVQGATVTATVTGPGGQVFTVPLSDSGIKGDPFAADGTYEGNFVDFCGNGSYQVTVNASNPSHTAIAGVGFPEADEEGNSTEEKHRDIAEEFQCQITLAPFTVNGYITKDMIPPGEIDEFDGTALGDGTVLLTWLAPGNNMYEGTAASYQLRYSSSPIISDEEWEKATSVSGLKAPKPCGTSETFITPPFAAGTYYFALRALDGNGAASEISEIVLDIAGASAMGNFYNGSLSQGSSGLCFIATAAYGSPLEPQVRILRDFRDRVLLTNRPGQALVRAYYRVSPALAGIIAPSPLLRAAARHMLWPFVLSAAFPWMAVCMLLSSSAAAVLLYRKERKALQKN